nr:serine/arginine repetitive matrix protein 1 [Quercus suber]
MSAALTTNVTQKMLRTTKFPPEFEQKVDMTKVKFEVLKSWVADELTRIMKYEDEIVTEMVFDSLNVQEPNIKLLQINLGGFLDKDAGPFCHKLWQMCLSAQQNNLGIPQELLEAKKAELMEAEKAREARQARRREEEEEQAQRERERWDRGRYGGRGGRDFDRRSPPRGHSRSPAPRRRGRDDNNYYGGASRNVDSYVPAGARNRIKRSSSPPSSSHYNRNTASTHSNRRGSPPRRRRSPHSDRSSRSPSRSPSPRRYRARSRSPRQRRRNTRGGATQIRSQHYRPDSRSPRRDEISRKRRRSVSRSTTPPIKRESAAPSDLVAATRATDKHRLSRELSAAPNGHDKDEEQV